MQSTVSPGIINPSKKDSLSRSSGQSKTITPTGKGRQAAQINPLNVSGTRKHPASFRPPDSIDIFGLN
ncbi:hypothetical protein C7S14_7760 [Burkholderia cepacia]|uniref:hypothetical protein n=1 Tax=Burkholderia cepacia TaxID=292 RepID=UPI0018A3718D|nr:hypothetical protein C7S14_7760 [Burkholderia cepacia]